ncbi:MAG: hypothetical protein JXL97_19775 [Bacteroidales bacterium]|nr:hypothetical protein [Bacteroidales bacterium]
MKKTKKWIFSLAIVIVLAIIVKLFFGNFVIYKGENILNTDGKTILLLSKKAKPEKSDIILINKPFAKEKAQVFVRCIAVSGEIIEIKNSEIFINNTQVEEDYETTHKYRINCFSEEATNRLLNEYKLIDSVELLGVYYLNLSKKEADILLKDSLIIVKQIIIESDLGNNDIFPQSYKFRWNEDNIGPITIPYKGFKIELNEDNFSLYKNTIIYFENKQIQSKEGKFFIGENEVKEYSFENDYFFVLNDNRANYNDSRIWGMIPKSQVTGTVVKKIK